MPRLVALCAALVLALPVAASAHPAGACVPTDRCERWVATYDRPSPGARPDQFATAVLAGATSVYTVLKDVAFRPDDPYSATAAEVVVAYDRVTGATRWTTRRTQRAYLSPHEAALSPDGSRLYVTSAAYDGFPVGAKDSWLVTTAYDTSSGAVLWSSVWDNRPDGTDSPKGIVVSPDGREVYVTGVTTTAGGDLDYVTIGYRNDGRELWSQVWTGPRAGGQDAPFGIAVTPDGSTVAVTGWSDGVVDYDGDFATVAYDVRHGHKARLAWVARYDGVGAHKSDRAMAVAADGSHVYVTGDSYAGTSGAAYDYATVAYSVGSGAVDWTARWSGGRGGFNSPVAVAVAASRVVVTGQSSAASSDDGNDAGTVAMDAASGQRLWAASYGPARHDDLARGLAMSPDGATAYVVTMDTPLVPYTGLSRLSVVAYDTASGAVRWQSTLDPAAGDALAGAGVAATGSTVAVAGNVTRGANPLGPPDQNVYDVTTAVFAS
jgi:hypothetical protein